MEQKIEELVDEYIERNRYEANQQTVWCEVCADITIHTVDPKALWARANRYTDHTCTKCGEVRTA